MESERTFEERLVDAQAQLAEARDERRVRRSVIPPEALVWMAVAPLWTAEAASASGMPHGSLPVEDLLTRMEEEGLCERTEARAPPTIDGYTFRREAPVVCFAMPSHMRSRVIGEAVEEVELSGVAAEIAGIGDAVNSLSGRNVPTPLARWAELARFATEPAEMILALEREVSPVLGEPGPETALGSLRAARSLASLLHGTFEVATDRIARRLELAQRAAEDRRRLDRFLVREDQLAAVRALIHRSEDDPRWALHFIGDGGVGKTMLLRHIAGGADLPVMTARVDFDYLSPDYPSRHPALLLEELADDLLLQAEDPASLSAFAAFDAAARRQTSELAAGEAGALIADAAFEDLRSQFGEALRSLPQRVVLLIDTCEELSRLRADGRVPDSVRFTFENVLEALYEQVPTLSVVFCGRRPLASAGAGWRRLKRPGPAPRVQPERPYLRLHEIRGFDREEAKAYLALDPGAVPAKLVSSILDQSEAEAEEPRFAWMPPEDAPAPVQRYSPFQLNRLAAWSRVDPGLTPEAIAESQDEAYIGMRIVDRIVHPVLRELLPGMALLGRFDRAQLALAWGGKEDDGGFLAAAAELAELEWVSRHPSGFFLLERGLGKSLMAWCVKEQRPALDAARRRLIGGLHDWTTDRQRQPPPLEYFVSAFRLLAPQPALAAAWWREVESQLAGADGLPWLAQLCESALAEEDAVPNLLRPMILATAAAVRLQTAPDGELVHLWADAEAALRTMSAAPAGVRVRVSAGLIAACRYADTAPDAELLDRLRRDWAASDAGDRDDAARAAVLAAAEAAVEHAERAPDAGLERALSALLDALAPPDSPALAGFAHALLARVRLLGGDVEGARTAFEWALATAPTPGPTPRRWLDWRAPDDVGSRVRLEFAVAREMSSADVLDRLGADLPDDLSTVELRFLCAAALRRIGSVRPPRKHELERVQPALAAAPFDVPQCNAHVRAGPLFAAVGEAMAECGDVADGLRRLGTHGTLAEGMTDGVAGVREADRAALRIARRMRLADERPWRTLESAQSPELADFGALAVLDGLAGRKRIRRFSWTPIPDAPVDAAAWPAWRHAHWRALYALPPDLGEAAVLWAASALAHERHTAGAGFATASCVLDAMEANLVAESLGLPLPCPARMPRVAPLDGVRDPLERLRLELRWAALTGSDPRLPTAAAEPLVGARAAALVALDEGELLALRLRMRGFALLVSARDGFERTDDPVGMFIASTAAALAAARSGELDDADAALGGFDGTHALAELHDIGALAEADWTMRPWQVRRLACRARVSDRGRARLVTGVFAWAEEHFGGEPGPAPELVTRVAPESAAIALPAELDGWRADRLSFLPGASARRAGRVLRDGALFVCFGGLLATLLGWLWTADTVESSGASQWIAVVGVGVVYAALLSLAYLMFTAKRLARRPVVLDLVPARQRTKGLRDAPTEALLVLHVPSRLADRQSEVSGRASPDAPEGLLEIARALEAHLTRLRGRRAPLRLRVERSIAATAWEAEIAAAIGEPPGGPSAGLVMSRTAEREGRSRSQEGALVVVTLAGTLSEDDMARRAWAGRRHELRIPGDVGAGPHALHIVGTPVESRSGVRLDIAQVVARQRLDTKERLNAAGLARLLPGLRVCVLQARTVDRSRSAAHEREQAAFLRVLAADLFTLGVDAIVTIPPVTVAVGHAVLARIAAALGDPKGSLERLPDAIGAARHEVATSPDVEDEAREGVAFDLCLYVALRSDDRVEEASYASELRSS